MQHETTDDELVAILGNETNMLGDTDRLTRSIRTAKAYVDAAIGAHAVPDTVWVECVIGCAADLYNSRDARLGVMDIGTPDAIEPYRVPTDPLRSVWPKLNAAGILTGGLSIA